MLVSQHSRAAVSPAARGSARGVPHSVGGHDHFGVSSCCAAMDDDDDGRGLGCLSTASESPQSPSETRPLVEKSHDDVCYRQRQRSGPLPRVFAGALVAISAVCMGLAALFVSMARDEYSLVAQDAEPATERRCLVVRSAVAPQPCGHGEACWRAHVYVHVQAAASGAAGAEEVEVELPAAVQRTAQRYRRRQSLFRKQALYQEDRVAAEAEAAQFRPNSTIPCYVTDSVKLSADAPGPDANYFWMGVALTAAALACGGSLLVLTFVLRIYLVWGIEGIGGGRKPVESPRLAESGDDSGAELQE